MRIPTKPSDNPYDDSAAKVSLPVLVRSLLLLSLALLAFGCAGDPGSLQNLQAGERAFTEKNYPQAISDANAAMASTSSDVIPEAHYLRGRAVEDRPKLDSSAAARDLQAAAGDYNAAITENPSPKLSGMVHMQLANVQFREDHYGEALANFTVADTVLDRPDLKMWDDYYMGICQQRLGRFNDADATFARVMSEYPNTEPAQRARLRQGINGFYVRVGTFAEPADANKAASAILSVGAVPMKTTDRNMTIIRTGGLASYAQAVSVRSKLAGQYPDASVVP